jgi:hypothetical protein
MFPADPALILKADFISDDIMKIESAPVMDATEMLKALARNVMK